MYYNNVHYVILHYLKIFGTRILKTVYGQKLLLKTVYSFAKSTGFPQKDKFLECFIYVLLV